MADQSQVVAIGSIKSSAIIIVSGVPQGSVLGPLHYITYSDDVVSQISPKSSIPLHADDVALYRCIHSPADYI